MRRPYLVVGFFVALTVLFTVIASGAGTSDTFIYIPLVNVPPDIVVTSDQLYVDIVGGGLHLVGELRNASEVNQGLLRAVVTLTQNDQIVHTASAFAMLTPLRPDERSPFDIGLGTPPNFDDYTLAATGSETDSEPLDDFALLSTNTFTETNHLQAVVGELRNDMSSNARFVVAVGTFYDNNGDIWRADQNTTMLQVLAPGQRSPFKLAAVEPDEIASYVVEPRGFPTTVQADADLTIVTSAATIQDETLLVSGQVRNDGSDLANDVRVVISLYSSSGHILNADFVQMNTLAAGAVQPFEVTFSHGWQGYDHFELQTQGYR
ncbi:MAG: FxLYD domain-containing protein [Chloroflexota bacterium]|nr:FxLYD domain-containing protein [Chloroflexota bacterium]